MGVAGQRLKKGHGKMRDCEVEDMDGKDRGSSVNVCERMSD